MKPRGVTSQTIRIFVKGLRNAHTLATHVYEKRPQTVADVTHKVEKLQIAQQLTATLLPSSTVNVMSKEEDQCFQLVNCPHWIHPSGTPAHHHRQDSNNRHHTRSTSRHHHWDRYRHSRSRLQSQPHRHRSHHDSHRGHSRSHHRDSRCHHRSTLMMPFSL